MLIGVAAFLDVAVWQVYPCTSFDVLLRGGGTRGAVGVLVMSIAPRRQAPWWRYTWRGRRSGDEHRPTEASSVVAAHVARDAFW